VDLQISIRRKYLSRMGYPSICVSKIEISDTESMDSIEETTGNAMPTRVHSKALAGDECAFAPSGEIPDPAATVELPYSISKNQLKKLKRKAIWEDQREDRKRKRKEKRQRRSLQKRELSKQASTGSINPDITLSPQDPPSPSVTVPVSVVIDCDFEKFMLPDELVSLAGQLIRCYADNRRAAFRSHLFFSSFGGKLEERFKTVLRNQHQQWTGVHFVEGDYRDAASQARREMCGPEGGELNGLLAKTCHDVVPSGSQSVSMHQSLDRRDSIVYLTSDSPNLLTSLEPYTTYVVGGIVDRNREKGLCYQRAIEHGVRTAKLPIAEYLALSSRHVLTTNQVVEIMLRWMECGDWGSAFMAAIPSRKGGSLKGGPAVVND
jgi:tRNA (guanine9-N1)-methyltransferase